MQAYLGKVFPATETMGWTTVPDWQLDNLLPMCSLFRILGGYLKFSDGAYVERTFTGLSDHFQARLKVLFFRIDAWENELFHINIDDEDLNCDSFQSFTASASHPNICGTEENDDSLTTYTLVFPHSSSSLKVKFYTSLPSNSCDKYWGISNFELVVYSCHSTCLTCSGVTQNDCLTCNPAVTPNRKYYVAQKTCIASCPSSTYDDNNICRNCHSTCLTCSGGALTQCLTCDAGTPSKAKFHFSQNKCIAACPSNTFDDSNICRDCNPTCLTCNGANAYQCLSCDPGNTQHKKLSGNTCVENCPSNNYDDSGVCRACHANCLTCDGGLENSCLTCDTGVTLTAKYHLSEKKCLPSCPSTTYDDSNICRNCHATCLTCSGSSANNCASCDTSVASKAKYNIQSNNCIQTCPSNTFDDSNICRLCDKACLTCDGTQANNCLSCNPSSPTNIYLYLAQKMCVANCPGTTYNDNNVCRNCDPTCSTCSGGTLTDCLTCDTNSPTNGKYHQSLKKCVATCPVGTTDDGGICRDSCHASCQTCSGAASNQCLSCNPLNGPHSKLLDADKTCISACPSNTYDDTNVCKVCHGTCLTCDGPLETNCLTCDTLSLTNGKYNLSQKKCQASCPSVTYNDNNICRDCHANCLTCSGGALNQCLTCNTASTPHRKFSQNQCIASCPSNTFDNSNICEDCHTTCLTCNGPNNNNCLSCDTGNVLNGKFHFVDKTCIQTCPSNTFDNSNICEDCHTPCLTCNGPNNNNCLSCDTGNALNGKFHFVDKTCIQTCPSNTYDDSNVCRACHNTCLSCSGALDNNCLSCNPSSTPNGKFYFSPKTCIETCPSSTFNDNNICRDCHTDCLTCSGSANNQCLSCDSLSATHGKFLFTDKMCAATCPSNTYEDSGVCKDCHSSCLTCNGPANNQCLSCDCESATNPKFHNIDKTCLLSCPSNTFDSLDICYPCYSACLTCTAAGPSACSSCPVNSYLLSGACGPSCPTRKWPRNLDWTCQDCHASCLTCTDSSSSSCLTCDPAEYLGGSSCYVTCPTGFWGRSSDKTCQPCTSPCYTCSAAGTSSCLSCSDPKFLLNNECVDCPSNMWGRVSDRSCQACDPSCATCSAAGPNGCESCSSAYLDPNSKSCMANCPSPLWGRASLVCASTCEASNLFGDPSDRICKTCYPGCATCAGSAVSCTSCSAPNFLEASSCVAACSAPKWGVTSSRTCESACTSNSFYGDISDRICKPCSVTFITFFLEKCEDCNTLQKGCLECFTNEERNFVCTKCEEGFLLSGS